MTSASVTRETGGVRLEKNGRVLHIRVQDPAVKIELQDVPSLLKTKFDAPLPGYIRIVFSTVIQPGPKGQFEVLAKCDPIAKAKHN